VDFAEKGMLGKARARPDLVRQTLEKARREGVLSTLDAVKIRLDQPLPLGYSSAGVVQSIAPEVSGFKVGDRVACAGGGFAVHAEYAIVPKNLVVKLPTGTGFETAAFATLGSIALHGVRLAEVQVGESAAVIGLGLLGLLSAQILQAAGCSVFGVDLDLERVALAETLGVHSTGRKGAEEQAQLMSGDAGFDAVIICADTPSSDPIHLAAEIARDRARIVAVGSVGLEIPRKKYFEKELSLVVSRSYGPGRYDPSYEERGVDYPIGYVRWTEGRNLSAVVGMMASGKLNVEPLITHRFPIHRAEEAYDLIKSEQESFLGVLLIYPDHEESGQKAASVVHVRELSAEAVKKVQLGVLGAGNFANAVLLPALQKMRDVDLVGIASATGLNARKAADRFGFAYATSEEGEILQDERVNTIAILTRHHLHARQVVAGLQSKKHVFCEKPLALNRDELKAVEAALKGSDRLLFVGFNRRFSSLSQKLRQFVEPAAGNLVMHYRVNAGSLPAAHWLHDAQEGGGRIIGEGCHFIDYLTFLADALPIRVRATGLAGEGGEKEDNIVIVIEFEDGSVGTISYVSGGDRAFPKERLEVFGGGRVAVLDDYRRLEMIVDGKRRVHTVRLRQDKGHEEEWKAFVVALSSGGPPPIAYPQLFGVSVASFAAVESLRSQKAVEVDHRL
jgi:predicted dehydrogenase/threonine dehydrogenase-like Zn-dependent dehydrogenase